jgi:curved DNA-binding protein CbpA
MPTHYEVLNVAPTASPAEIRAAYLGLARKLHPDRNPHPEAEAVMRIVNDSYQVLGDPAARATYDDMLFGTPLPGAAGEWWVDHTYSSSEEHEHQGLIHGRVGPLTVAVVVALIVIVIASAYAGPVATRP